jgi:hypothetical protein
MKEGGKMPISLKDFRVKEGSSVDLGEWSTDVKPNFPTISVLAA